MRKPIIRILIFLITLCVGLAFYFIWYLPSSRSTQEITPIQIETSPEFAPTKVNNELAEPWIFKIAPCVSENSLKQPNSDWRGKGVLSGGVVNRRATCGVLPEYPQIAKDKNVSDVVTINVLIDEIGEVKEANAKSGNALLQKSAVKAAYQTRFCPTLLGGASYKVKGILMYKFDSEKGTWLQDPIAPDNPFKNIQNKSSNK